MFSVTVHDSRDKLTPLQFQWREAERTSSRSDRVLSFEEYVEGLRGVRELQPYVLNVSAGDAAMGLVPLVLETRSAGLGIARILRLPVAECDTLSAAAIGPHPGTTLTAALRHLAANTSVWDAIRLDVPFDVGRTRTSFRLSKLPFSQKQLDADGGTGLRFVSLPTSSLQRVLFRADTGFVRYLYDEPLPQPPRTHEPPQLTVVG